MTLDVDEMNTRNQERGDIELPRWSGKFAKFIYLGLGLALLLSSLLLSGCASAKADDSPNWRSATEVLPEDRARQIVSQNSSVTNEEISSIVDSMRVAEMDNGMLIVDFNNPLLTGRIGSLFTIYNADGDRIFNRYLSQQLPEGVPVIQLSDRTHSNNPCIIVNSANQPAQAGSDVLQTLLCFEGSQWVTENQKIVPVSSFE